MCLLRLQRETMRVNEKIDFFDPQRQRDQCEQIEPGRLEQLPQSKTNISHDMNNSIEMRLWARLDSN